MTRKRFIKLVMGFKGLGGKHFSKNEAEKEAAQITFLGAYSEVYQAFFGARTREKRNA